MPNLLSKDKHVLSITNVRRSIVGIDTIVPLQNGQGHTYINFDNAASTPALKQVLDKINDFMPWYAAVHRGAGRKSQVSTTMYEQARDVVRDFVGANDDEHVVIFGKNTTEAINKLSYRMRFSKDDVVIISGLEHHSNDLPWRRQAIVQRVHLNAQGGLDINHFKQLLRVHAGHVKLVAISGASNVTGHLPDIHELAKLAHLAGAQVMVDAAQLAAHREVKMKKLDDLDHLDYVVLSAHKLYAPFGSGVLIGRKDTFESGAPEYSGGGTIKYVTTDDVIWADLPDKEEAGSPNVVGAIAMAEAMRTLQTIGMPKIAEHETALTRYALTRLSAFPKVTLYGDPIDTERSSVITFNIQGVHHALVAAILNYEWGIGVRSGCFCAQPYVAKLLELSPERIRSLKDEITKGKRNRIPGMVRLSFGMYNTLEEVDTCVAAIESICTGEFSAYEQNEHTGEYTPKLAKPRLLYAG